MQVNTLYGKSDGVAINDFTNYVSDGYHSTRPPCSGEYGGNKDESFAFSRK